MRENLKNWKCHSKVIARPVWLWLLGAGAHQTRPRFHNFQFMTMVMAMKGRVEAVEVYLFQLSEGFELRARALVHFAPSACRDVRTHRRRRRWEGSPQSYQFSASWTLLWPRWWPASSTSATNWLRPPGCSWAQPSSQGACQHFGTNENIKYQKIFAFIIH